MFILFLCVEGPYATLTLETEHTCGDINYMYMLYFYGWFSQLSSIQLVNFNIFGETNK